MGLIVCPKCWKQTSDETQVCPSCGSPLANKSKQRQQLIGLLLIIAMLGGYLYYEHVIQPRQVRKEELKAEAIHAEILGRRMRAIVARLQVTPGQFVQSSTGEWIFTGDSSVFELIRMQGESGMRALVECLDQSALARATMGAEEVYLGVICHYALTQLASCEHDRDCPPFDPEVSNQDLTAAKERWRAFLELD